MTISVSFQPETSLHCLRTVEKDGYHHRVDMLFLKRHDVSGSTNIYGSRQVIACCTQAFQSLQIV